MNTSDTRRILKELFNLIPYKSTVIDTSAEEIGVWGDKAFLTEKIFYSLMKYFIV